ncbi:hypothetical protein [Ancylobacter radicis]|uniref:Secreted protein n=1 Tax=Ancylobacter radicis TaxID=2836179 RepID=A0ABS5R796_9HYPH|nr:hypothetical protein [Ancylobacter radicis]MBS9477382.1 hypothetical protein [Ancylobacter radicis]
MPPFIVLALGALGAAALVKRLASESRRVNAELDARREGEEARAAGRSTLRRDPVTGDYRPQDR